MHTLSIVLIVSGAAMIYWALKPSARSTSSGSSSGAAPATQASSGQSGLAPDAQAGQGAAGGGGSSW